MKKFLLLIFFVMTFTINSIASPFLVCDPPNLDDRVNRVQVELNGVWENPITIQPLMEEAKEPGRYYTFEGNTYLILKDLNNLPDGENSFKAKFINIFNRESEPTDPFVLNNTRPPSPSLLLIP